MNVDDYLLDVEGVDWSEALRGWTFLIPSELTIWLANRFGDLFVVPDDGAVHILDIGQGSFTRVADDRDTFCRLIDQPGNANDWLMIPLVDRLVATGHLLTPGRCYGYRLPPLLGGGYDLDDIITLPILEHLRFHADLHRQLKDLPDGTRVRLVVDDT